MNHEKTTSHWPKLIIALVLFFLLLTGWSVQRAATDVSKVTNPRYYSHGLKYNRTLVEKQAAASLGWQLDTALAAQRLEASLTDREGRPVAGARASLTLFDAEGSDPQELPLTEISKGRYVADLPAGISGQVNGRLDLNRDGAALTRSLLLNL